MQKPAGAEKKQIENDVASPFRGEDQDCGGIYLPLRTKNRSYTPRPRKLPFGTIGDGFEAIKRGGIEFAETRVRAAEAPEPQPE